MKEIRQYMAFDGAIFDTEKECLNYEEEIKSATNQRMQAIRYADALVNFCLEMDDCKNCPFYNSTYDNCGFNAADPLEWTRG